MAKWCYGLVNEGKKVVLAEVYFAEDDSLFGYSYVLRKELRSKKDVEMILRDLRDQLTDNLVFDEKDFKGVKK